MLYSLNVKSKVFKILTYIRHKRPNDRHRNTVKDVFFYRIGLDDTAIPHIKIKITEIPLEKKKKAEYCNIIP